MADSNNEGKALDAVLRFIEARMMAGRRTTPRTLTRTRCGESTTSARSGDCSTPSSTPASSLSPTKSGSRTKTRSSSIRSASVSIIAQIRVWDLYFSVEASAGLTANDVGRVQDALIKWVEANAARIPVVPRYGRRADSLSWEEAAGVPFRFYLRRTISQARSSALEGRFFLRPIAPANLEQQRVARLETASERKSPKLAKWKRDSGARTVLVLEEDDLSLTNHFLVADALLPAEATSPDAPDEVFMVSTGIDQTWWVVCLRGPGVVDDEPMPHREFDPMKLVKLTSR
jgi:hypothetical protein